MKYLPINKELFVLNRKNFVAQLPSKAIAVFNSNDIMPTNADGSMGFRQNNDLFYLSGIDQEESILVIFPSAQDPKFREVLFIKETSELMAIWEGHKFTKKEAQDISGISTIIWTKDFDNILPSLVFEATTIYLNTNEHLRSGNEVETRDTRFIKACQAQFPLHQYGRLAPIMQNLRAIKSEQEVALMQDACNITEKAFRRILGFVKPNVWEFEIEAEFMHEILRNRSTGPAYHPIIASGANACVLHYVENNQQCKDGDLILLDLGAEYANYSSDMTRTIPVNGKFSPRQKAVYNAVLRVMKQAVSMLVVGNTLEKYHQEVGKLMQEELIQLNLLDRTEVENQEEKNPLYKKYFMHGTSHFLGLDTHDVGDRQRPFEAGMVFTCEPGIYIKEEGLGIRIENNYLITAGAPIDLMKNIPIEVAEIEALMHK